MIPKLVIKGWTPGKKEHELVYIVEQLFDGMATRPFVHDVPLGTAKIIVKCVEHCRRQQEDLNAIARVAEANSGQSEKKGKVAG